MLKCALDFFAGIVREPFFRFDFSSENLFCIFKRYVKPFLRFTLSLFAYSKYSLSARTPALAASASSGIHPGAMLPAMLPFNSPCDHHLGHHESLCVGDGNLRESSFFHHGSYVIFLPHPHPPLFDFLGMV